MPVMKCSPACSDLSDPGDTVGDTAHPPATSRLARPPRNSLMHDRFAGRRTLTQWRTAASEALDAVDNSLLTPSHYAAIITLARSLPQLVAEPTEGCVLLIRPEPLANLGN